MEASQLRLHSSSNTRSSDTTGLRLAALFLNKPQAPSLIPTNLTELSSIVKHRLNTSIHTNSKQKRSGCQQWLTSKGANLSWLGSQQVLTNTQKPDQQTNDSAVPMQGQLLPIMTLETQYIQLTFTFMQEESLKQEAVPNLRKHVLKCRNGPKKLNEKHPKQANRVTLLTDRAIGSRKQGKQRAYAQSLMEIVQKQRLSGKSNIRGQLLRLATGSQQKIWRILEKQLKGFNQDLPQDGRILRQKMLMNSLRLVEGLLQEQLPLNMDTVTYYLTHKYLNHCQNGDYIYDARHGSFWGKALLLFRARRLKQLYKLLNQGGHSDKGQAILSAHQKALRNEVPVKIELKNIRQKDIFYQQMQFSLAGKGKYSSQILSDPCSLDCIWILLRKGIFYDTDYKQFIEFRNSLVEHYRNIGVLSEMVPFLAYLLDYETIISMGESYSLDRDDLIHMLIFINRNPFLTDNREFISQRLGEELKGYIAQVAKNVPNLAFQFYILQLPNALLVDVGSSVMVSNQLFSRIDWNMFKQHLSNDLFQQLLKQTVQKEAQSSGKYLVGADLLVSLADMRHQALTLVSRMLIMHIQSGKQYARDQVENALSKMFEWSTFAVEFQRDFGNLLNFFKCQHRLARCLIDRNHSQLQQLIRQGDFAFLDNIDYSLGCMFNKLAQLSGGNVYFIYLGQILKAAEFVLSGKGMQSELKQYRHSVLKTCQTLADNQQYAALTSNQAFTILLDQLRSRLLASDSTNFQ